jgi:hypothetical protein
LFGVGAFCSSGVAVICFNISFSLWRSFIIVALLIWFAKIMLQQTAEFPCKNLYSWSCRWRTA